MSEKKLNLDITVCVNCNNEPIDKDAFPHYGDKCVAYLKKHGRLPDVERGPQQSDLDGEAEGSVQTDIS